MKYKLISYELYKNDENEIKFLFYIKRSFLGFFKKDLKILESGNTYTISNQRVWLYFDTFKIVDLYSNLQSFCIARKKEIIFKDNYIKILEGN